MEFFSGSAEKRAGRSDKRSLMHHGKSTFRAAARTHVDVRQFRLVVVQGPDLFTQGLSVGRSWTSTRDRCEMGKDDANDVVIKSDQVSRFHCEIEIRDRGALLRDLGSTNETLVDGVSVESAYLRDQSVICLGDVRLRFELLNGTNPLPLSTSSEMEGLIGASSAMRACFKDVECAAKVSSSVVLAGETGTGKTALAQAIHRMSKRNRSRFVVLDCGTLMPTLIERELFGHVKGAFSDAYKDNPGLFEHAHQGTIFLDEIAELPLDLQTKLLRVIQERKIRRLGAQDEISVDVRIIAATHKDLRKEVSQGRFREDLYYRLNVLPIRVPALRERPDDVDLLVDRFLDELGANAKTREELTHPEALERLRTSPWPGNIRQLHHYIERCVAYGRCVPVDLDANEKSVDVIDIDKPLADERTRVVEAFERQYLTLLLDRCGGNVSEAARAADITRPHFYRLLQKYGIRETPGNRSCSK